MTNLPFPARGPAVSRRRALRTAVLATTAALSLSACVQPAPMPVTPTPPVVVPESPATLGLYTLRVSAVEGQATALSVSAASLVPGLSFELISHNSVIDREAGVLHLRAAFRVRNGSGRNLTAPTYIPVDTASTVGGTPYRNVRGANGQDASARAGSLSPEAAVGAGTPTPFVTGLGSAELDLGDAAGTVQALMRSGWVGSAIPAGGTGEVVFGTRIDLSDGTLTADDPQAFDMVFAVADGVAQRDITPVSAVQGRTPDGDAPSPLAGQTVTVEGVVTADFRSGLRGFYLQEADINADRDPNTSEGVFVFCGTECAPLFTGSMVGQLVRVTGPVSEFFNATQVNVSGLQVLRGGQALPAAQTVALPLPVAQRERLEGMRVTVSGVVTGNFTLGRGGSVDLADDRVFTYTQLNRPSAQGFAAHQAEVADRILRVDDGSTAQNPPVLFGRGGQPLSAENTLRGGDGAQVTGVMGFGFDGWSGTPNVYRVHATEALFTPQNPRPGTPEVAGLRVAAMNVLNYFTTLNASDPAVNTCTAGGVSSNSSVARGARTCEEFLRQQAKIVSAIAGMDAGVIGLMEIQNDYARFADSSAANLVAALNAATAPGRYAYIQPPGNVGTDAIAVGFLYQPARVTPVGRLAILDRTVDPSYDDRLNRPTWAHTFQSNENGGRFTAAVVHFKSKGSACEGDPDLNDGQGNCNLTRTNAASALARWLKTDPTGAEGADLLIMGDLNAYAMEDPIAALEDQGFVNAFPRSAYSYQFSSQWGSLDHILVSPSLRAQMLGGVKWNINADEPTVLDYTTRFKTPEQIRDYYAPDAYRSSDHDPLLIGLQLAAQTPLPPAPVPQPPAPQPGPQPTCEAGPLRISQVYGGGGNSGAPFNRDFVELFNPLGRAVSTADLSVQYASAGGTSWNNKVDLPAGCIPAGGYYLIGMATGSTGAALPTPDLDGGVNMSGTSGKVALLRGTAAFSGQTPVGDARTVDFVGYGGANAFEGSGPTPALSNITAALRRLAGCQDTDDNAADFTTGAPQPRNSASPANVCN